jgi:hypothetical protein
MAGGIGPRADDLRRRRGDTTWQASLKQKRFNQLFGDVSLTA